MGNRDRGDTQTVIERHLHTVDGRGVQVTIAGQGRPRLVALHERQKPLGSEEWHMIRGGCFVAEMQQPCIVAHVGVCDEDTVQEEVPVLRIQG